MLYVPCHILLCMVTVMAGVDVINHQKCPHFHKGCSLFGARTKMIAIIFSLNFHILEKVESTVGGGGFQHLLRHSYVDCLFVFLSFLYCLFVFLRIVFVFLSSGGGGFQHNTQAFLCGLAISLKERRTK